MRTPSLASLPAALALVFAFAAPARAVDVSIYDPRSLPVPPIGHVSAVKPERIALPNGVVIYLLEDHDLPVVKGQAYFRSSPAVEPADRAGLLSMTGDVIRSGGTPTHSGDWLDDHLSALGASVSSSISNELGSVGFRALSDNATEVIGLWADVMRHPAFPGEKLELAKVAERQAIASRNDEMFDVLSRAARQAVNGKDSPWARVPEYATIEPVTPDDCRRAYAKIFVPERLVVAVFGDFHAAEMKKLLTAKLGDWKKSGTPAPVLPPTPKAVTAKLYFAPKDDVTQSGIIVAQPGLRADDPDYAAMEVLEQGLGGGFSSRLVRHIRTERGLAYAAGASSGAEFQHPGVFNAYTLTKSESTMVALGLLRDDVRAVTQAPFSPDELQSAKQAVVNGFVFNFEDPSAVLFRAAYYETVGYPADFLQRYQKSLDAVTGQSVLEAARRKVTPDAEVAIIVGKESDFAQPLTSAGLPLERMDISIPPPPSKHGAVSATPEAQAKGKQWLDEAVKQAGGAAAWAGVKTMTEAMDAKLAFRGQELALTVEESWRFPDHRVEKQKLPFGEMVQGYDGHTGWANAMGKVDVDPKAAADLEEEKERSPWFVFAHPENLSLVALDEPEKVDGVSYRAAILSGAKTHDLAYLFDANGRLAGFAYQDEGQGPQMPPARVVQLYGDWSAEGALSVPHSIRVLRDDKPFLTGKVTSVKLNPELADAIFAKPTP